MPDILKRPLGLTGLHPTLVGFGALEIGRDWGVGNDADRRRPGEEEAARTLHEVLDLGVTLIDTASAYHRSEERIGASVSGRRSEFILATKCGEHNREPETFYDFSRDAVRGSVDASLRLLKTDVIDILQIHFGPDPAKVLDDGECVRAMQEAKEKGQVRFLGASVDGPVLDRCIKSADFDVVQIGYSLLNQTERDRIAKAQDRGIGVLIRSGLAGGWLTSHALLVPEDKRPPKVNALLSLCRGNADLLTSLALHFLARQDGISSILVGSKSAVNIRKALETITSAVDDDLLEKASAIGKA
jgi:aryl-alcohol dehydrogenase-like predicted oxidoreductase